MMCALDYAGVQQSVCKDAGGCRTVRQASAAEFRPATCEQQRIPMCRAVYILQGARHAIKDPIITML